LQRAKIGSELVIEDGGHDWDLWREQFPRVMGFLARAHGKAENGGGR
jgi:S-formylglutathione hydrolase FrmB